MSITDKLYDKLSKEKLTTFIDRMTIYEKLKLCVSLDDVELFEQVISEDRIITFLDKSLYYLMKNDVLYYMYKNTTYEKYLKYIEIIFKYDPTVGLYYQTYSDEWEHYLPDEVLILYENPKYIEPIIEQIFKNWLEYEDETDPDWELVDESNIEYVLQSFIWKGHKTSFQNVWNKLKENKTLFEKFLESSSAYPKKNMTIKERFHDIIPLGWE